MKKSLTRVLSLVLVLVMMLGVLPMASAANGETNPNGGTVTVNSVTELVAGGSSATVTAASFHCNDPDGEEGEDQAFDVIDLNAVTITLSNPTPAGIVEVSGNTITPKKAGTAKINVSASYRGTNWTTTATTELSVTVAAGLEVTAGKTSLVLGESTTLSATYAGSAAEGVTYSITSGSSYVDLEGSTVTAKAAGTATITATKGDATDTVDITVNAPTATISAETLSVPYGESKALSVSFENLPYGKTESDVSVAWSTSANNQYIELSSASGKSITVKGKKVTSTAQTVTAAFTLTGYTIESKTCAVTVTDDAVISCESKSAPVGDTVTLTPTLKVNGTTATDVKYSFSVNNASTSSEATDKSYVTLKRTSVGTASVTIGVISYKLNGTTYSGTDVSNIESITAKVSFYDTSTVAVTLESGKTDFDFGDEEIFSKVVINDNTKSGMVDYSMKEILQYVVGSNASPYKVYFDGSTSSTAVGSVTNQYGNSLSYQLWTLLSSAEFRQNGTRTGTASFTFTVVDSEDLTIHKANVKITIAGGEGDIHYETTYNKAITIDADDFEDFWDDLDLAANRKLEYVTLTVGDTIGTFYTSSTKKTKVNNTMKFYLDPDSSQYDLDDVYYVPLSSKTTEYIESINFTAVSNYGEKYYGTMTIGLNTSGGDSITSRGVVFSTTYSKSIAETYNTNTGKTLGYVVFELPKANVGTLYSELTLSGKNYKVADSAHLKSTDKLWYNGTSSQLDLADAAFVPAAGYAGEVTLSYTAYDTNGNNAYSGVLRLKVTTKTASAVFSDVTAKGYSWAADSVDFLYYEGTAQGSNGKYTPAANITRRDFMLMLYRAFLEDDYGTYTVSSNFPDVKAGTDTYSKEIYQAVGVAKYLGIAQGTNGYFNPTSNITRQEAMVLIYRTLETCGKELRTTSGTKATSFKDYSSIGTWATTAISSLVSHGVIQGTNDKINPLSNITRAEMACILHRVITY